MLESSISFSKFYCVSLFLFVRIFLQILQMLLGFAVVITLGVITRNTFLHLRRSISRNYMLIIMRMKG